MNKYNLISVSIHENKKKVEIIYNLCLGFYPYKIRLLQKTDLKNHNILNVIHAS